MKLRLVIAGEGYLRSRLQALASELEVAGMTQFLGAVPHHKVPDLLVTFSVFANLSKSESFGVAPLEAAACELPVVATNVGNLPDIVRAGVTGTIVPPEDPEAAANAFLELADNREMREAFGTAGRQFVLSNYNWALSAERMESVYQKVTTRKN